jgi:hypothetical protein
MEWNEKVMWNGDREREYVGVGVSGEREGSRVQKGSNAPDGAGSNKVQRKVGDREREVFSIQCSDWDAGGREVTDVGDREREQASGDRV